MPISIKFPPVTGNQIGDRLDPQTINWQDSETKEAIKQNLRVMILTNPGEYQHDIEYGVGIREYLFEPNTLQLKDDIRNRILDQARRYMTYISISNVEFEEDERNINYLGIKISYFIRETTVLQTFDLFITADEAGLL